MKFKLHLFLIATITIVFSSCKDGDLGPSKANTTSTTPITTNKCLMASVEEIYEGEDPYIVQYNYDSNGNITSFGNIEGTFDVSYDKKNEVSQLKDKLSGITVDYLSDTKGNLTEIKYSFKDDDSGKTFTFGNKYTLDANGKISKIIYKYDYVEILFALAFGATEIKASDFPEFPLTFTYDKNENLSDVSATIEGKKVSLYADFEHDQNLNPQYGNKSLYRINLFFKLLGISSGEVLDVNFLSKNNIKKYNAIDEKLKKISVDFVHEINDKKLPTKSTFKYLYDGVLETTISKFTYKCN